MKLFLDPLAPNTNFILGAALAGGDPIAAARMIEPMPKPSCTVLFRGDMVDVIIDKDAGYDPETNTREIEWHFADMTPEQHTSLQLTEVEEDSIYEQICLSEP